MFTTENVSWADKEALLARLIEIRNLQKSIDIEDKIITKELLWRNDSIHKTVFGGKYIQEMSRKTYKLNKEAATIEDVEAVHPDLIIVKKDVDAEKLFEINPDLVVRNLSRYYTLENYDPSRHVQRA